MFLSYFNFAQFVNMPKVFYCSKCTLQHPRPVGKKCQYEGESLASDVEDAAPPSTDPAGVATVSDKILLQLQRLGEKMDSMDRRVQHLDKDLSRQVLLLVLPTVLLFTIVRATVSIRKTSLRVWSPHWVICETIYLIQAEVN